jgi:hypothetical protein
MTKKRVVSVLLSIYNTFTFMRISPKKSHSFNNILIDNTARDILVSEFLVIVKLSLQRSVILDTVVNKC